MRVQTLLKNKGGHTKFVRILQTLFYFPYLLHVSMYLFAHLIHSFLQNIKKWEVDQDFCALHYAP